MVCDIINFLGLALAVLVLILVLMEYGLRLQGAEDQDLRNAES